MQNIIEKFLHKRRIFKLQKFFDIPNIEEYPLFKYLVNVRGYAANIKFVEFEGEGMNPFDLFIPHRELLGQTLVQTASEVQLDENRVYVSQYKKVDDVDDYIEETLKSLQSKKSVVRLDVNRVIDVGYRLGIRTQLDMELFFQDYVVFMILFRAYSEARMNIYKFPQLKNEDNVKFILDEFKSTFERMMSAMPQWMVVNHVNFDAIFGLYYDNQNLFQIE